MLLLAQILVSSDNGSSGYGKFILLLAISTNTAPPVRAVWRQPRRDAEAPSDGVLPCRPRKHEARDPGERAQQ